MNTLIRSDSYHIAQEELYQPIVKEETQMKNMELPVGNEEVKSDYKSRRASSNAEFNALINEYKKSNEGDYIEFIIEFSYVGGGRRWKLNKRYSDFVYIHNKILNSAETDIPRLPPKIENRSSEQLEKRMYQLEDYLNKYLQKYPINPLILEFCEFTDEGSQVFRELSHMKIKTIECDVPRKDYKLTDIGTVDTFYAVSVKIYPQGEQNPMQITIQITYDVLKQFHIELKHIARMGDIDISTVDELPSAVKPNGEKLLDQEMMENISEYLNSFKENVSLLNLIIFKKLLSDNIILDGHMEEEKSRPSKFDSMRLMGSIKNETELFEPLGIHENNSDSEEEDF